METTRLPGDFAVLKAFRARAGSWWSHPLAGGLSTVLATLAAVAAPPTLRHLADVKALTLAASAEARPVEVEAVVTYRDGPHFTLQDESGGIFVELARAEATGVWTGGEVTLPEVRPGARVAVEAVTARGGFAPMLLPRSIRVLGHGPLPPAVPMVPAEFFTGAQNSLRVKVRCVVQGAISGQRVKLYLDADPGRFLGEVPAAVLPGAEALVDAKVEITGVAHARFNSRGEFLLPIMRFVSADDVVVLGSPPAAPFELPLTPLADVATFRVTPRRAHRVRVEGTVTFHDPGRMLYVQDGQTGLRVETGQVTADCAVGDWVSVAGFVDETQIIRSLKEAVVRALRRGGPPVVADDVSPDAILDEASRGERALWKIPGDYDGRLIRFPAKLVQIQALPSGEAILFLASAKNPIVARLPQADRTALADLLPGSELAVTGIAQLAFRSADLIKSSQFPTSVDVLLRTPDDLAVLRAAPWWTLRRALQGLGIVAGALVLALFWGWQLRRRVRAQAVTITEALRAHRDSELEYRAALRERQQLASDLHDGLQQTLTGACFRLEAAEAYEHEASPALRTELRAARAAARRTLEALRQSVQNLHELDAESPELAALLRQMIAGVEHWSAEAVTVSIEGPPFHLSRQVIGSLLMLVQEAIANAFRHGRARRVCVAIIYRESALELRVVDDGCGFDPGAAPGADEKHYGLESMRHRARWLSGSLELRSAPGQGTAITVRVPRPAARSAAPASP